VIRSKLLLAALACLLASALASVGVAQQIQAPMFGGVGARAIGMGGAFVAVADGTTGPQWNPAGEANGRFAVPLGAVGVAQNFEANNIQDLLNDLDDARDGSVAAAQSLLLDALDWQNIQVAAAPYLSLGPVRGFTLYGNVQASGMANLAAVDAGGNRVLDVGDSVTALAGVAALGNVGLALLQTGRRRLAGRARGEADHHESPAVQLPSRVGSRAGAQRYPPRRRHA